MIYRSRIVLLSAAAAVLLLLYLAGGGISDRKSGEAGWQLLPGFRAEQAEALSIRFPGHEAKGDRDAVTRRFVKTGGAWQLMRGVSARPARGEQVERLLAELESLRAYGPAAEGRKHWDRLGVTAETGIILELQYGGAEGTGDGGTGAGEKRAGKTGAGDAGAGAAGAEESRAGEAGNGRETGIYIGEEVGGTGRRYLRIEGEEEVLTAELPAVLGHRELSFWADMRIFPGHPPPEDIIRLELESFRGDRLRLVERSGPAGSEDESEAGSGSWVMYTGSAGDAQPAAEEEVLQLLRTFFALQAAGFAEDCPGSPEAVLSWTVESAYGTVYRMEVFPRAGGRGYIVCSNTVKDAGSAGDEAALNDADGTDRGSSAFQVSEEELDILRSSLEQVIRGALR
jgi:hypothetical protein